MADTVNLMVVGVTGGLSREEITKNLVDEFGQDASSFNDLIAAAFGDTDAYAAQSGVNFVTAEAGSEQLQKLGLECKIVTGEEADEPTAGSSNGADELQSSDTASAASEAATPDDSSLADLSLDDLAAAASDETADKKPIDKGMSLDVGDDLDFSDELGAIDVAMPADTTTEQDSSSSASTEDASDAEDADLDFSDELDSIGNPEAGADIAADKADEPAKADAAQASTDEVPATEKETDNNVNQKDDGQAAIASVVAADTEELTAELVDPAPLAKEKKDNVVLDDGGLSLSDDDSAPLTKPKTKSNPDAADDGGLSLADNSLSDSSDLTAGTDSVVSVEEPASQDKSAEPAASEASDDSSASEDLFADEFESLESPADEAAADESPAKETPANESQETETEVQANETKVTETEDVATESQASKDSDSESVSDDTEVSFDESTDQLSEEDDTQSADATVTFESDESDADDSEQPVLSTLASIAELAAKSKDQTAESASSVVSDGDTAESSSENGSEPAASGGLVLSAQPAPSVVPQVTPAEDLDQASPAVDQSVTEQSADQSSGVAQPDPAQMNNSAVEPIAALSLIHI